MELAHYIGESELDSFFLLAQIGFRALSLGICEIVLNLLDFQSCFINMILFSSRFRSLAPLEMNNLQPSSGSKFLYTYLAESVPLAFDTSIFGLEIK